MFRHLLVPLDGSPTAELVLPAARFFAAAGASISLLHVIEKRTKATIHQERHLIEVNDAQHYLEDIKANAFEKTTTIDLHVHDPGVGDVARSITAHGQEMGADLIVLCTHGRGDLSRFLFGSIAEQVLATARVPVLLVPHQVKQWDRPFTCRRILAPVDVAGRHETGVDLALDVACLCRAEIHFVAAVPTFGTLSTERAAAAQVLPTSANVLLEIEQDEARDKLARWMTSAKQRGLTVQAEVIRGRPADAIIEAARRLNPDLIVMATHRHKGLDARMSGSVGSRICAASPVCLLIAPILETPSRGESTDPDAPA